MIALVRTALGLEEAFAYIDPINYLNRNDLVGDNLEAICIGVFKPSSASSLLEPFIGPYLNNWPLSEQWNIPLLDILLNSENQLAQLEGAS